MKYELVPLVGALPLRLGMTKAETELVLGQIPIPSAYENDNVPRVDAIGLGLYYDAKGLLEFIELSSRCYVKFGEIDVFEPPAGELLQLFVTEFGPFRPVLSSYLFEKPCIMVFVDDDEIRSLSCFTKDYSRREFGEPGQPSAS